MPEQHTIDGPYTASFYNSYAARSHSSAQHVLAVVFDYFAPASVADVGCGVGAWLAAAEELGCSELAGFDGNWVNRRDLLSKQIEFQSVDFESDFVIEGRFDLCMTLEVAEHISEQQSEHFVDQLCGASDVVLFSAAVPRQGGAHHVNEQLQSYWIRKFNDRSFECFDVIRPQVWQNDEVEFWYRQNAFLFVRSGTSVIDCERLRRDSDQRIPDVVHPGFFAWKLSEFEEPDLRAVLRHLRSYFRAKQQGLAATSRGLVSQIWNRDAGVIAPPLDTANPAKGR